MTFIKSLFSNFPLYLYLFKCVEGLNAPIIETANGLISGIASEDAEYYSYLGIPYGVVDHKNPFGPSSPAPKFEGIFNATDGLSECPQINAGKLDCLNLNVFIPSKITDSLLPVLVFIHGGAFEFGSSDSSVYRPKYLTRHDIILVAINYRLGPYGYMCTDNPRVPGNQASKDQLLALEWVSKNIESFGGDPQKVTVAGNSAGAMSIDLITYSDEGPKFFQQVILQSGVAFLPSYAPTLRDAPMRLAEFFGLSTKNSDEALDFIATIPPSDIIWASYQLGLQFRPCIENQFEGVKPFMTENWATKEQVLAKGLNVMIGFNENEALGLFLQPGSYLNNIVEDSLRKTFDIENEDFKGMAEVRCFFFGDEELNEKMLKEAIDLNSDHSFVYVSIRSLRKLLESGAEKAYLYLFSYVGERNIIKRDIDTNIEGAVHADEIGYLFDVSYLSEPNDEDRSMLDCMTEMWSNFVKYGNPTPSTSPTLPVIWKPITLNSPQYYIHLDKEIKLGTSVYQERMAFWDLFLELNGHLQIFKVANEDFEF